MFLMGSAGWPGLAWAGASPGHAPLHKIWVAVKALNLSYYIGETRLFTIYTHYGNLI